MMPFDFPKDGLRVACSIPEYKRLEDLKKRKFFLYGEITNTMDDDLSAATTFATKTGEIIEHILEFNYEDWGKPKAERRPIMIFIDSPGGDMNEGFALVDAIKLSKTPVYTINMGEWSSMSFLIGITGHKRFSFPSATFLLHDGASGAYGTTNKVQDRVKFEERFESEVVKAHVLAHSKMESVMYDALARVEYYMLPSDALKHGFIDEIITDIDTIL